MSRRLEEDDFLFRAYRLADYLKVPLAAVMAMSLEEFEGWYAYRKLVKESGE